METVTQYSLTLFDLTSEDLIDGHYNDMLYYSQEDAEDALYDELNKYKDSGLNILGEIWEGEYDVESGELCGDVESVFATEI